MFKSLWHHISAAVLLALLASAPVSGQPSLKLSGYTENFDSMGLDGTHPPDGWSLYTIPGSSTSWQSNIPEDQLSPEFFGSRSLGLTAVLYPTVPPTASNNGYNAATSDTPNDRALATSPAEVSGAVIELVLTNNTGITLTSLAISYDIRRFTVGAGTADTGNGPGADELPGYWLFYSLDGGSIYTNVSQLNPDIVSVPNTVGVTHIPTSQLYLYSVLPDGQSINLCWVDDKSIASSPDQIIGLDNVRITIPSATPPASPLVVTGYNADVISDKDSAARFAQPFDANTFAWFESGAMDDNGAQHNDGLPAGLIFLSATGSGATYQIQPANANNVLQLGAGQTGTLTLTAPAAYNTLYLIASSGNGTPSSAGGGMIHFADGSTQAFSYNSFDWCNGQGSMHPEAVFTGPNGRADIGPNGAALVYNTDCDSQLYETVITIDRSHASVAITSIDFAGAPDAFLSNIFSVSGQ